jgi:hypothetical protein
VGKPKASRKKQEIPASIGAEASALLANNRVFCPLAGSGAK